MAIVAMDNRIPPADWESVLSEIEHGKTVFEYGPGRNVFHQGAAADAIFYLRQGTVKLAVTSEMGKEAVVAVLEAGEFFGEACLSGQLVRLETATTLTVCSIVRIERALMKMLLHNRHEIAESFILHLLSRSIQYETDLVAHLFDSSEKRLARVLIQLAHFGRGKRSDAAVPRVSQEELAHMVGTTRARVSHFMNEFRKRGLIDYGKKGDLTVHSGLLRIVLHE